MRVRRGQTDEPGIIYNDMEGKGDRGRENWNERREKRRENVDEWCEKRKGMGIRGGVKEGDLSLRPEKAATPWQNLLFIVERVIIKHVQPLPLLLLLTPDQYHYTAPQIFGITVLFHLSRLSPTFFLSFPAVSGCVQLFLSLSPSHSVTLGLPQTPSDSLSSSFMAKIKVLIDDNVIITLPRNTLKVINPPREALASWIGI